MSLSSVSRPELHTYRFPLSQIAEPPSRETVGSKALNLMIMSRAGLPVPPGFVLGTELCRAYMKLGRTSLKGLKTILADELSFLGSRTGRLFGDTKRPLLVSVRSGAAVSMPGMMETVLNVGLTPATLPGLLRLTGNPRLVHDCYRRLIAQYAEVVSGMPSSVFESITANEIEVQNLSQEYELDTQSLRLIGERSSAEFQRSTGKAFPADPMEQLYVAVEAVLKSWNSDRAKTYRKLNSISDEAGTAVIVQKMVFGNAGPGSGSGVGFTRSPADGSVGLYCDYLPNAQGEDVVSGRRSAVGVDELERRLPEAFRQLMSFKDVLEKTYGDMQDFEFTVEDGHLFMLQARSGKRTPLAALRIANDLVAENVIRPQEALARLNGLDVESIEIRELVVRKGLEPAGKAIPASSGVAVGVAVMDPLRVGLFSNKGNSAVLLCDRLETSDIDAVAAAGAIVTSIGARTSHAAVVARQLGKVCLVGCKELIVDASRRSCRLGDKKIVEGDAISLDGNSGLIYLGKAQVRVTRPSKLLDAMHNWQTMTATK